jgi:hypothetical protein
MSKTEIAIPLHRGGTAGWNARLAHVATLHAAWLA